MATKKRSPSTQAKKNTPGGVWSGLTAPPPGTSLLSSLPNVGSNPAQLEGASATGTAIGKALRDAAPALLAILGTELVKQTVAQRGLFGGEDVVDGEPGDKWAPLFSAKTDEHSTDAETFAYWREYVRVHFGVLMSLDVSATHENAKCAKHYTVHDDGRAQNWKDDADDAARAEDPDATRGAAWMNCPYSDCLSWVNKALEESRRGLVVVALLPSRTDTAWFHSILNEQNRCEIFFLRGRLRFGDAKGSAPFPSVVVVFKGERSAQ